MKNGTFIHQKNIYYILSKRAEPALYFIVRFSLCREPEGKNGLAHVSEHVMLSLIENEIKNIKKAFGFFAHTGYSAIQFNFLQLHNEENIISVYHSIMQALRIKKIDKTVLKAAKEHVLKECRELKLKYSSVVKENKFLTGYKNISLPVGKVKDVKSITEDDVVQFINKNYSNNRFLIVNKNKIKSLANDEIKTVTHNKNIFNSIKINIKHKKNYLHITANNPKYQEITFCIKINKNIFKTKYYYLTLNTIGSILMFIQSLDVLKNAISNTLSMGSQGYEDSLYMENFFKLLNIPSEKKELIFDPNFKKIEFKNISFKYPLSDKYVIKNFSFCFNAGNTYGFVGLNGSGKTTLIKLLLGFYSSYEGKILIDGIDIREFNLETYYHYVSLVFQDFIKYPFTVVENIGLGDEALFLTQDGVKTITENKEVYQAALFSKADEFIRKLPNQYATILGKEWQNGTQISIGQWQKIAIARAAVKDSKILIFDEPTASIDPISEYDFFKSIKELAKNKLCILVTHRFANIKAADNILVFSDGELVQKGNHKKLFNIEGLYKKLYTMQAESYME